MALGATREATREVPACPADTCQHHISILEVPTPLGLLSSPRGIAVSSLALVEISIHLGMALDARWAYGRLPLFLYLLSVSR